MRKVRLRCHESSSFKAATSDCCEQLPKMRCERELKLEQKRRSLQPTVQEEAANTGNRHCTGCTFSSNFSHDTSSCTCNTIRINTEAIQVHSWTVKVLLTRKELGVDVIQAGF